MKLVLYLKDVELSVEAFSEFPAFVTSDSSLSNCHKPPEVSEQLSLYSIKLYIGIIISRFSALSTCSSFIWFMHFVNGAQFLNANLVLASRFVAVLSPVAKIYASERPQRNALITFVSN